MSLPASTEPQLTDWWSAVAAPIAGLFEPGDLPTGRVAVVGDGLTAAMVVLALRQLGLKPFVVTGRQRPAFGMVDELELVPIFPPAPEVSPVPRLRTAHMFVPAANPVLGAWPAGSFGSIVEEFGVLGTSLSLKQFGIERFNEPLLEVRGKRERHYGAAVAARTLPRAGFLDGCSPYRLVRDAFRDLQRAGDVEHVIAERLDGRSKLIVAPCGIRAYDMMIVTCDVNEFCSLLGTSGVSTPSAPASFVLYSVAGVDLEPNILVYDHRAESGVFRAFSSRPDRVVVQRSLAQSDSSIDERSAIAALVGCSAASLEPVCTLVLPTAYPTDPISDDDLRRLEDISEAYNALLFGRYAEWRYVDLHELDWSGLRASVHAHLDR